MELLDCDTIENACRLCLKHDGIKLPIFGEVGVQRDVAHKINICFALVVYETDPLSKLICHRCLYKLEQSYEFRSDVLTTFQHLKKALLLRRNDPEIDKYLSATEDEVIIIGGSETLHPENKHGSESAGETVVNEPVQPSGACITFSANSSRDPDEQIKIVKHAMFDGGPGPAVDVCDAASELHTGNRISESNNVPILDENEITCVSDKLNYQDDGDNRIESNKQGVVQIGLVGPQNVLETFFTPQPGGKSGKIEKHYDGCINKRALSLPENVDLHWCNFCQKYLKSKKQFKKHTVKVHDVLQSPTYKCKCKKKFHTLFEMLTHQQTHLRVQIKITEDMLLKCNVCDKKFADNSILTAHLITHSDKFNRKLFFKSCTNKFDIVKFKMGQKKKGIINETASPSALFVCHHCRQIFETASSLSLHINSKHCFVLCNCCVSGDQNISGSSHVCQLKEIRQATVENVSLQNRQISSKVSHSMNHPSDNTSVHNVTQLSDNMVSPINHKTPPDHNQSLFTSQVNQCSICAEVYGSKNLLRKHQKTHTASEVTSFSCTFCNITFMTRSSVISHLRKHSGGEYYHCKYCTKIYSDKEIFLSHKCLSNRVYPFCNLQLSHSAVVECAPQPHRNDERCLSLLGHNDLPKIRQINASGSNQGGSLEQSEEQEKEITHCVKLPRKRKNYNESKNCKYIKRRTSEHSRAAHVSKNENCMKCPFCHRLVNPESMYQHIYENHPDSNNIT